MIKDKDMPDTLNIPLYNRVGEVEGEITISVEKLGGGISREVLRQAVITYEANRRSGTAKTKDRSEVSYSGAKPWPQKGTGRARAGTRSSPIWVGGGVTHGPRVRNYRKKLNKKMRKKAVASALIGKALDNEVKAIEEIALSEEKTKSMAAVLKNMGIERSFLIVLPQHDKVLWRCTRNIPGSSMCAAYELNAYKLLKARDVVFTQDAFEIVVNGLEKFLSREKAEALEASE